MSLSASAVAALTLAPALVAAVDTSALPGAAVTNSHRDRVAVISDDSGIINTRTSAGAAVGGVTTTSASAEQRQRKAPSGQALQPPKPPSCSWQWDDEKFLPGYDHTRQVGRYLRIEIYTCPPGAVPETLVGSIRAVPARDRTVAAEDTTTPAQLAERAASQLQLPKPTPARFPATRLRDGRPDTLIGWNAWFWAEPASYRVLRQRTATPNGRVWAEVTATPLDLTIDPGDGTPSFVCRDGGTPYRGRRDVPPQEMPQSPTGCDHAYQRSSAGHPDGMLSATYTTRWRVTWVGSGNTKGVLPDITRTNTSRFAVSEIQVLVTNGRSSPS